ncbi:acyl-CoA desaturase [Ferrimonas balearica]|uniref:acyl-CoA desaturase n=1 Tax=Ferrimonas balearica TaxID=44012 RepID=UPI001C999351|nr:fatty acid desaturase [Ferrimonas balearica]MBY5993995.1 fatty acid desaturase [Ferrimonas balearica]
MSDNKPRLILVNNLLFALTLLGALVLVPLYGFLVGYQAEALWVALLFWLWSGISITAGYHRLWSHKAWQAHPVVQWLLAIGGAMALQNSILHWSSDHRRHHKHVDDNQRDPYSAGRGFWFSHIGWMLREYQPLTESTYNNVRDLQKNAVVMNQHNHYGKWVLATNVGLPALVGWFTGDVLGMLLLAGVLRLVLVHHGTFFINSLAHIWGTQPFSDQHSSRDNGVLALVTFGEGYHNFHHTFEYDYRNGIRWWHFDPTKWLIRGLEKLGLAKGLRRVPADRIESARLAMQLKSSQRLLADHHTAQEWLAKLEAEYDHLLSRLQAYYGEKQRQLKLHKHELDRSARQQLTELHQAFEQQKRQWQSLRAQAHAQLA